MNKLRRFIERGWKGYCSEDLWSFDSFLSDLLVRSLTEFKKNCHTYPADLDEWDEWMIRLDEMIECFREQTRSIENMAGRNHLETYRKRRETQKRKLHRGLELLEKYYYDLWD